MAKKRFKVNILSTSSVERLKNDLMKYQRDMEYKTKLLAERLAELGVEIARVQLADLDAIFTGELTQSIHSEYKGSLKNGVIFAVVADSKHSIFVEFGTGVVGKQDPYPYPFPEGVSWEYATGKTIRQLIDGRYGWFYPSGDGKWYFTEGMPSRPFMYNTALELESKIVEIAKEIFR